MKNEEDDIGTLALFKILSDGKEPLCFAQSDVYCQKYEVASKRRFQRNISTWM